jgi:crotonobetainyl-CoA:carnitine CoA-transferase CaiB-like acyl-CoA transferase
VGERRARSDEIDREVAAWCATRPADEIVARGWDAGVPAARVLMPHEQDAIPPVVARAFYETLEHPVVGPVTYAGSPVKSSARRRPLHHQPAPTLGQHNREILEGLLGVNADDFATLVADGVVATAPRV